MSWTASEIRIPARRCNGENSTDAQALLAVEQDDGEIMIHVDPGSGSDALTIFLWPHESWGLLQEVARATALAEDNDED